MRTHVGWWLTVLLLLASVTGLRADEPADPVADQKKAALAGWTALEIGEPVQQETAHLLLYAPPALDRRLKDIGVLLEKFHDMASKNLQIDKEKMWSGKLAVFLFTEREQFTAFVRRVEKRRPEAEEVGSYQAEGETPHVAAAPPQSKYDPSVEIQAGQQIAAALLQRKVGKIPLPDWVTTGFGRATWYHALGGPAVSAERNYTARLIKDGTHAWDAWGTPDADKALPLEGSVTDYLAYGPGSDKFAAILAGFEPEENQQKRTTEQALMAAGVKPETLDRAWHNWAPRQR